MKATVCLLALVLAALCPSAALADTRIFVEDFSDASGNPAFDPLFNHSCVVDDPEGNHWRINGADARFFLSPDFVDTITFNLQPDWSVVGASVEAFNLTERARFIGTQDTAEFVANSWPFEPPLLWEVSANDIGEISTIELTMLQGSFDNVTIQVRVVPEPATAVLLAAGLLVALVGLTRRRFV
ncbi:MAG: PEP-CTERM sorting domain-containing protein [Planctomycetia bacterium]|nr:PEP-CTERM sorting domain-containing protein [Planctomycetia bacterium]